MKKLFYIYLLLNVFGLNAQTIKIEYEVIVNRNKAILSTKSVYYYIQSNNKSIYYNDGDNMDIYI